MSASATDTYHGSQVLPISATAHHTACPAPQTIALHVLSYDAVCRHDQRQAYPITCCQLISTERSHRLSANDSDCMTPSHVRQQVRCGLVCCLGLPSTFRFAYDAVQTFVSARATSSTIAWCSHIAVKLTCQYAGNLAQGELAASREQLDSKARDTATLNSKVELLQEEVESMTRQVCHHCL